MARILYFPTASLEGHERGEAPTLGDWMLQKWPVGSVRPRGLRIYKNSITRENDLTEKWLTDESVLMDPDGVYILAQVPHGAAIPYIVYAVIAVVAAVAVTLLMPKAGGFNAKNSNNSSTNNALAGRSNTPRPGERIADIRGGVRAYPDLLMDYRLFVDKTEYEVQFLCLGAGTYEINDVRDGITPVSNITGESLAFYKSGNAPGYGSPYMTFGDNIDINTFPVMTAISSNEADGSELKPPNYDDINKPTFRIYSNGNIETSLPDDPSTSIDWAERAPVASKVSLSQFYSFQAFTDTTVTPSVTKYKRYDLSGTYDVTFSGDNIVSLDITDHNGWQYLSSSGQSAYLYAWNLGNGDWMLDNSQGGTRTTFTPSMKGTTPYTIGPYLIQNADELMVNLYAQNGMYKTNGDVYTTSATFRMTLSDANNSSNPVYNYDMTVKGRLTESVGQTLRVNNPYPNGVNVSMRRITDTDKGFNGSVVDAVKWRDLYAIQRVSARSYGDVTLIHAVTKATNAALKQKERKLNMDAVRIYNGSPHRNFADVIMSMHTDPYFGRRDATTIDEGSLRDVEQQLLDYFGDERAVEVGYTFDDIGTTYEEGLQIISQTVNCMPYQLGNLIYFWPELPQATSAMQFGHVHKEPESDKRTRSFAPTKNYTGVQVKYFDNDTLTYLYVQKGETTNLNKIELKACQSYYLANIVANREYNKLLYQRISHETTLTSIGLQASPGMRIDMVDNTRLDQSEGHIEDINGLELILSNPVVRGGNYYTITITGRTGVLENIPIELTEDDYVVILKYDPEQVIYTGYEEDKTAYVIRADDDRSKLAMLVQTMEPQGKNNNYTVNLTAINYDDRYYKDDK